MSLVEIARFAGLPEAQIAASRLRADGCPVLIQNEHWGASDFTMVIAMGGFRLWAPASEAEEARALIARLRANVDVIEDDDLPREAAQPYGIQLLQALRAAAALLVATVFGSPLALLLSSARQGEGPWRLSLRLCAWSIAAIAVAYGLVWLAWWLQAFR
ncbi:hypothetical protein ACN2C6_15450 [Caulobacter sp. ErkDOM-YI]|uniref:hypothetical protein n=1 Tax=unclassified Caulobacter TaxID=2648921 RepID=UPI003AF46063